MLKPHAFPRKASGPGDNKVTRKIYPDNRIYEECLFSPWEAKFEYLQQQLWGWWIPGEMLNAGAWLSIPGGEQLSQVVTGRVSHHPPSRAARLARDTWQLTPVPGISCISPSPPGFYPQTSSAIN